MIGVMILKRSGLVLMVIIAVTLFSSDGGIEAQGGAVSVDIAEGVLKGVPCDQRKPHIHLGCCHHSILVFLGFWSTCWEIFHLALSIAVLTDVLVATGSHNA